jgi:hypothetical protein
VTPAEAATVTPFHISYSLSRQQRLRAEVLPWMPAVAGTVGFGSGALYLGSSVSPWCLFLLVLPVVMYRGLFLFAFEIVFRAGRPVELRVGETEMEVRTRGESKALPLDGVFQVFRDGDAWTILHLGGHILTIPADAITAEQVEYLRSFAHRHAAARARSELNA